MLADSPGSNAPVSSGAVSLTQMQAWYQAIQAEVARVAPAQQPVVEQLVITLLCEQHSLLTSAPGMAKWRTIEAIGRAGNLALTRLRGSEDLTADEWRRNGWGDSERRVGLWLVDHFDDLPTKLRNMVFHGMDEQRRVPAGEQGESERRAKGEPWVVFASRAPRDGADSTIAAVHDPRDDRFFFQIDLPYPPYQDEFRIVETLTAERSEVRSVVRLDEWEQWRAGIPQVDLPFPVLHYVLRLVRATRIHRGENPDFVYEWLQEGAGPRAAEFLLLAARARAACAGRPAAITEDVVALAPAILRHRLVTNQNARQNGIDVDRVIRRLLSEIPPRVRGDSMPPKSAAGFTLQDWVEQFEDS